MREKRYQIVQETFNGTWEVVYTNLRTIEDAHHNLNNLNFTDTLNVSIREYTVDIPKNEVKEFRLSFGSIKINL